jgi:beta-lactam-binding protein with PASTA domain
MIPARRELSRALNAPVHAHQIGQLTGHANATDARCWAALLALHGVRVFAMWVALLNAAPASAQGVAVGRNVARTWDFETGDLRGWTATGNAFDHQPTFGDNPTARGRGQPAGQQGQYWIGTYELYQRNDTTLRPGGIQGDGPQGTLTSPNFQIGTDSISFLIGGGDSVVTGVELVIVVDEIDRAERQVFFASVLNSETMRRVSWDVRSFAGQTARIRIIDGSSVGWGHVNADDFRFFNAAAPPAPADTLVPDLTGQDVDHASALLESTGLRLGHIDSVEAASKPPGLVWNQSPLPRSRAVIGTEVNVYVAKPPVGAAIPVPDVVAVPPVPGRVLVPKVTGERLPEAKRRIASAGLVVGRVRGARTDSDLAVKSQKPLAGGSAAVGSSVDLTLTTVPPRMVTVPNLHGLNLFAADSLLGARGLKRSGPTYVESTGDSGAVIGQLPSAELSVPVGSPVHLYLALPGPWRPDWIKIAIVLALVSAAAAGLWYRWSQRRDHGARGIPRVGARPGAGLGAQEFHANGPSAPDFEIRFRPGVDPGVQVADIDRGALLEERRENG